MSVDIENFITKHIVEGNPEGNILTADEEAEIIKGLDEYDINESCFQAFQDTIYVVGGKWKVRIYYAIYKGSRRFRDIERSLPKITTRMLSRELKEMEMNNLITRTVIPSTPVKIEYEITKYSIPLVVIIWKMMGWGYLHRTRMRNNFL